MDARFHNLRVYKEKSETKIDYYEKDHVFMLRPRPNRLFRV